MRKITTLFLCLTLIISSLSLFSCDEDEKKKDGGDTSVTTTDSSDTTVSETSNPDTTKTDTTKPVTTQPETTVPETTAPSTMTPDEIYSELASQIIRGNSRTMYGIIGRKDFGTLPLETVVIFMSRYLDLAEYTAEEEIAGNNWPVIRIPLNDAKSLAKDVFGVDYDFTKMTKESEDDDLYYDASKGHIYFLDNAAFGGFEYFYEYTDYKEEGSKVILYFDYIKRNWENESLNKWQCAYKVTCEKLDNGTFRLLSSEQHITDRDYTNLADTLIHSSHLTFHEVFNSKSFSELGAQSVFIFMTGFCDLSDYTTCKTIEGDGWSYEIDIIRLPLNVAKSLSKDTFGYDYDFTTLAKEYDDDTLYYDAENGYVYFEEGGGFGGEDRYYDYGGEYKVNGKTVTLKIEYIERDWENEDNNTVLSTHTATLEKLDNGHWRFVSFTQNN